MTASRRPSTASGRKTKWEENGEEVNEERGRAMRVFVRARPLLKGERAKKVKECINFPRSSNTVGIGQRCFSYDGAFDASSTQEHVYSETVSPLLEWWFSGYNASILAYGQSGSGKTHTMGTRGHISSNSNESDTQGVFPRLAKSVFEKKEQKHSEGYVVHIYVSFLELYNENIRDLLRTNGRGNAISIREDADGNIALDGSTEKEVKGFEEMMWVLKRGSLARSSGKTAMNEESSRSHCVCTVTLQLASVSDANNPWRSKLHVVDLAGSERNKKTNATGSRFSESVSINKGLLTLGSVINALTDSFGKNQHIPYRESKLTRLLQDSLGGNSATTMIACIRTSEAHFDETLNTLKYASRARYIRNKPRKNEQRSIVDDSGNKCDENEDDSLQTAYKAIEAELINIKWELERSQKAEQETQKTVKSLQKDRDKLKKYVEGIFLGFKNLADEGGVSSSVLLQLLPNLEVQIDDEINKLMRELKEKSVTLKEAEEAASKEGASGTTTPAPRATKEGEAQESPKGEEEQSKGNSERSSLEELVEKLRQHKETTSEYETLEKRLESLNGERENVTGAKETLESKRRRLQGALETTYDAAVQDLSESDEMSSGEKDRLVMQRDAAEKQLATGNILGEEDEANLREAHERIDSIDTEAEYVKTMMQGKQKELEKMQKGPKLSEATKKMNREQLLGAVSTFAEEIAERRKQGGEDSAKITDLEAQLLEQSEYTRGLHRSLEMQQAQIVDQFKESAKRSRDAKDEQTTVGNGWRQAQRYRKASKELRAEVDALKREVGIERATRPGTQDEAIKRQMCEKDEEAENLRAQLEACKTSMRRAGI